MNPKDRAGAKKPNLSVLPFAPLLKVIPALYEGRRKYGPWNWRAEEVSETIYADAAIRHIMQWISGEDIDPDSGVHHFDKAIAGLLVVRDAQLHGCSIDDRFVNQNLDIESVMESLAGVNERYPEPVPSALPPREDDRNPCCELDVSHVGGCCNHRDTEEVVVDEGITGGETMTEEDAMKVAEYLGLQDACKIDKDGVVIPDEYKPQIRYCLDNREHCPTVQDLINRYSQPKVVTDRVRAKEILVGDPVRFTDSATEYKVREIEQNPNDSLLFSVDLGDEDEPKIVWYRQDGSCEDAYSLMPDCKQVITIGSYRLVKDATFALMSQRGFCTYSDTVAGSGSYELVQEDVGKKVLTRDNREGKIVDYDEHSAWPFQIEVEGEDEYTVTKFGQWEALHDLGKTYDHTKNDSSDIVRIYH